MNRFALLVVMLAMLQGCAYKTAEKKAVLVSDCEIFQSQSFMKKVPVLVQLADSHRDLCHALQQFSLSSGLSESELEWLSADERFTVLQALVSNSHQHPENHFADSLWHYVNEDNFVCRQPVYAAYFADRYGAQLNYESCPKMVPFYLLDTHLGGHLVQISPDNVREIHVTFASEGDSFASSFGHVSIRLVVCPDASSTIDACQKNLFNHIFLGYVARIDEFSMNPLKGVFGGYDAHLAGATFMETYRSNTLVSDRNVFSLPLVLSQSQVEQIVRELSEIHWRFRGEYRFFTNNCATLLQDMLNLVFTPEGSTTPDFTFMRPDRFFNALKNSSMVRAEVLSSLDEAESNGYFFSSNANYYQQAFLSLTKSVQTYPFPSLNAYARTPAPNRLLALLSNDDVYFQLTQNDNFVEAQVLIEERQLIKTQYNLIKTVAKLIDETQLLTRLKNAIQLLDKPEDRRLLQRCYVYPLMQVEADIPRFAGIPYGLELGEFDNDDKVECQSLEAHKVMSLVVHRLLPKNHALLNQVAVLEQELEQTFDNIETLKELL
ncbi:lipoprotein N-acyltransferase Lnb domain-containing protein [Marinomonas shanghaiensis]|jgi:hypothetical protein|uniref:lipoprotein N-acyltransferase Lnb domain-containing protein n=1 Tax=Marinomonas shanghaiensis TaxID=2202418 RepID=UPI0018E52725|nr:DUF4105 domain-containing protein [Marinomonas shanghaiensis]